jgi:hypothetical protein
MITINSNTVHAGITMQQHNTVCKIKAWLYLMLPFFIEIIIFYCENHMKNKKTQYG